MCVEVLLLSSDIFPCMMRKLSEEESLKLTRLYRQQECLWDIRSDGYNNKQKRTAALQKIREGMAIEGFDIAEIKAKIKSIRSTYYLELDKIEKSTRSGAGGNVYVPRVKWFNELNSFIKTVAVKRINKDPYNTNTNNGKEAAGSSSENPYVQQVSPCTENESDEATPTFTHPLRSKRSKLSQITVMIKDLKSIIEDNKPRRDEESDLDMFAKCVSSQLKKLSEEQAVIAQERIQSILTQCRLTDIQAKKS